LFVFALCTAIAPLGALAQIPTQCFEIESVLVDACSAGCANAAEGQNEMVRFITGPVPIAITDLDINWPNNSFNGLVQNSTTASLTAQLNAAIESCGVLLQPPGGLIPPGSQVLLITSTDMCVQSNSFAGLTDTLYVIFQNAGNTAGHFANQNNGSNITATPSGTTSLRTLVMTYVPTNCVDSVTYDRSQLVNVYGTYGGSSAENDGATANFTWPGAAVVTYSNSGCQAPITPLVLNISTPGGTVACGSSIELQASAFGTYDTLTWSGGSGTFTVLHDTITSYTLGGQDNGPFTLYLCATGSCGQSMCDSVTFNVNGAPNASITTNGPLALCPGSTLTLTASGGSTYEWNTNATSAAITISDPGTYTVTATNSCGSDVANIVVTTAAAPQVSISGDLTFCAGASTVLTATGNGTMHWSNGPNTASITVSNAGTYTVTTTNGCGSAQASVTVSSTQVVATATASPTTGSAPLPVSFTGSSVPDASSLAWTFGDAGTGNGQDPQHTFTSPGTYTVTLTATDVQGCTDSYTLTIEVNDLVPSSVIVPNVFSPNQDGKNDAFRVISTGLLSLQVDIFNRYGQRMATIDRPNGSWNGTVSGGNKVSEGTYFYQLVASGADGRPFAQSGTLTVLR
jgi:gliding motility-associated-like protein